jgi:hypothetical protein
MFHFVGEEEEDGDETLTPIVSRVRDAFSTLSMTMDDNEAREAEAKRILLETSTDASDSSLPPGKARIHANNYRWVNDKPFLSLEAIKMDIEY